MTTANTKAPTSKRRPKSTPEAPGKVSVAIGTTPTGIDAGRHTANKPPSKAGQLVEMLKRAEGATLDQMVAATGWLPHTTRAALTGLKKKGREVTSNKADGVRTYRLTKAAGESSENPPVDGETAG